VREKQGLVRLGGVLDRCPARMVELAEGWLCVRDRQGQHRALVANAAQRRFEQQRGQRNIILKARQMGITTWIAARFFLRTITHPGTLTLQVAHTREAAEAIFRVVQRMWEGLPENLREGRLRRGRANVGQMTFPLMDSEFRVGSASDENVGRGMSLQNLHCSEVSRWPGDASATLAGLRAALAPEGELVLESTPNGAYGAFYEEWMAGVDDAVGSGGALVRHFLPWWMEPEYVGPQVPGTAMTAEECALVVRHQLMPEQIGFRRSLEHSYGPLRSQEFAEDAETCFRATGACCFDVAAIERRLTELPLPVERRCGGALLVWLPPQAGRQYVVGVDTAGGGDDGDFAAVQVVELRTGLQCAELQQKLRPSELARVAAELAHEYGGALLAVERNNHGAAVLAYLESRERYTRLYRQAGLPGWLTTSASKPEMVARLGVLLEQKPECFLSRRLLAECRTFVAGERGRTGAAGGAHDDLVMAMAVAQSARTERLQSGSPSTNTDRRVA
jgi:hypothetical protein